MPDDRLVVSDTSPLLNLALIDELRLLEAQFDSITVPEAVWEELETNKEDMEHLRKLKQRGFLTLVRIEHTDLYIEILTELDRGETAAITHAIEAGADLVLIDERDGRNVARRHDLTVTGVVGILLRASKQGAIELEDCLNRLRQAGFWISDDLYEEVLARGDDNDHAENQ